MERPDAPIVGASGFPEPAIVVGLPRVWVDSERIEQTPRAGLMALLGGATPDWHSVFNKHSSIRMICQRRPEVYTRVWNQVLAQKKNLLPGLKGGC